MAKHPLRTIGFCTAALALLASAANADAAIKHKKEENKASAASLAADFSLLARGPVKKCASAAENDISADGWKAQPALCAWQGRLQMRRWNAVANAGQAACVSAPAVWWSAMRSATGNQAPVWQSAWTAQAFSGQAGPRKKIFALVKKQDGAWQASEWSWLPPQASKLRRREAGRWNKLAREVNSASSAPGKIAFGAAGSLMRDWAGQLNGRPAEMSAATWKWQDGKICLRMEEAALEKAQLHLPYSKEDVRLEQRSAMQLSLARANPQAKWLIPFQVLPVSKKSTSKGVQYEAVWAEDQLVRGQLWIPQKIGGAVLRLRIAAAVPAGNAGDKTAQLSELMHKELSSLAEAWSENNDR